MAPMHLCRARTSFRWDSLVEAMASNLLVFFQCEVAFLLRRICTTKMTQCGLNIVQFHLKPTPFLITIIRDRAKLGEQGVNKQVGCGLVHG